MVSTQELEVFGDVTVFGDFQASSIPPYAGTIEAVTDTAFAGTVTDYARGDHVHNITQGTLETILDGAALIPLTVSASS